MTILIGIDMNEIGDVDFLYEHLEELLPDFGTSTRMGLCTFSPEDWERIEKRRDALTTDDICSLLDDSDLILPSAALNVDGGLPLPHPSVDEDPFSFLEFASEEEQYLWCSVAHLFSSDDYQQSHFISLDLGLQYLGFAQKLLTNWNTSKKIETSAPLTHPETNELLIEFSRESFEHSLEMQTLMYAHNIKTILDHVKNESHDVIIAESRIAHALYFSAPQLWEAVYHTHEFTDSEIGLVQLNEVDVSRSYSILNLERYKNLLTRGHLTEKAPLFIGCTNIRDPYNTYFEIVDFTKKGSAFSIECENMNGKLSGEGKGDFLKQFVLGYDRNQSDPILHDTSFEFRFDSISQLSVGSSSEIMLCDGVDYNNEVQPSYRVQKRTALLHKGNSLRPDELAYKGLPLIPKEGF